MSIFGALREEVTIEVSEEAMRRFGLTFDDVARAIRGASVTLAGGQVRTDTGNIQVAARNLADSAEDFERSSCASARTAPRSASRTSPKS